MSIAPSRVAAFLIPRTTGSTDKCACGAAARVVHLRIVPNAAPQAAPPPGGGSPYPEKATAEVVTCGRPECRAAARRALEEGT